MAEVIRMPLLSDTMTEGKILKWNKQVGDKVKGDDVLADVETDMPMAPYSISAFRKAKQHRSMKLLQSLVKKVKIIKAC